jgi:AraC-like protein
MAGHFAKIVAGNPYLIAQTAWENLPPSEKTSLTEQELKSQEWAPLDRRRFRIEPESYRTESLMANVGALRLSRNTHNRAKQTTIRAPGVDGFAISMIERGAGGLILPGSDKPVIGNATTGLIYSVAPATRLTASDQQSRLYLRLPTAFVRRKLEAVLDGQQVGSIAFQPVFDQTRGAGATIRRLSDFLFAELQHSDTLLTNEIVIRSFEENLALCLLLGLPHNYSERLRRQKAAAAPGNVRRAEAFMEANASMPLSIAEIAEAAGCGVRALQIAFRRFRGTTRGGYCSRPDWNRRERRCCAPAKRNRWPGSPLSTASAVRPSSPASFGANMASIRRSCCGRGAASSPDSTTPPPMAWRKGFARTHRADSENKFVLRLSDSLFIATARDQPGSRKRSR